MKSKRVVILFLVAACTGWAGFYAGVMREPGVTRMAGGAGAELDYLVSTESFSEVEHARAVLDALAERYVERAQTLIAEELMSHNPRFKVTLSSDERPMVAAIRLLDEVIPEFHGTEAELPLVNTLLYALKRERAYDRWLDVYLDALRRHPADTTMSALAEDAVAISEAAGREQELAVHLRCIAELPTNNPARSRIERSLLRAHAAAPLTRENHENQL